MVKVNGQAGQAIQHRTAERPGHAEWPFLCGLVTPSVLEAAASASYLSAGGSPLPGGAA